MTSRFTMQRILCPTDYSECSRYALERAINVAAWFRARVTVLHVIGIAPPARRTWAPSVWPPSRKT